MTRSLSLMTIGVFLIISLAANPASAQKIASEQTASQVTAELVKGKLNPAASKPGDQVELRLSEDMKSNGSVVINKGSTLTGVVKNVLRIDSKVGAKGQAQSMMELEWLLPPAQGKAFRQVIVALRSVSYASPIDASEEPSNSGDIAVASPAPLSASGAIASTGVERPNGQSNLALLSMPFVEVADSVTSTVLQNTFGITSDQRLFRTGRGEAATVDGSKHRLDIYSYFSNDTVLTSPASTFEISTGAQLQFLVGVQK